MNELGEIPFQFQNFWDFVFPSLVELATLVAVFLFLSNSEVIRVKRVEFVNWIKVDVIPFLDLEAATAAYRSLWSITTLVLVIAVFYTCSRFVHWVGDALPGNYVPNGEKMLYQVYINGPDYQIWNKYSNLNKVTDLRLAVQGVIIRKWEDYPQVKSSLSFLYEREVGIYSRRSFYKFVLLFIPVICILLGWKRMLGKWYPLRIAVCLCVLFGASLLNGWNHYRTTKDIVHSTIYFANAITMEDSCSDSEMNILDRKERNAKMAPPSRFDFYYYWF